MGSPLAPILANTFMGLYESKWLNEYNLNKTNFNLRYVSNKRYPNVKFTIEKQINHSIDFFDVLISGSTKETLTLETYRKSTYTKLLLSFKSFTWFSYNSSLIKCLINRSTKICNNWNSFHNDLGSIKFNLIKNTYPSFLINKVIKQF